MCSTHTIRRGSDQRSQYCEIVIRPLIPFICIAPSPTIAIAGRSGCVNFAAMAYGTPGPIVAKVPLKEQRMPSRILRSRAYQLADDPESHDTITRSGSRGDSSQKTRWGLSGSPSSMARSSTISHHSRTPSSTVSRHSRSALRSMSGNRAERVSRASPTRFTSIG